MKLVFNIVLNAFATIFMFLSPPYAEEINVERWCKNERSNKKVGREMAEHAVFSTEPDFSTGSPISWAYLAVCHLSEKKVILFLL